MLRQISRAAVGGYVKAVRLPLDTAARVAGRGNGRTSGITLALDRAEATARDVAGRALGDAELRHDAGRRRLAADERERALRLRAEAEQHEEIADESLSEGRQRAARRRGRATQ